VQDLTVHVLRKAHLYDPARGSVNTFVVRVVDSAVALLIRDRKRIKRAAGFSACSLGDRPLHSEKGSGPLEELLDDADGCRRIGVELVDEQVRFDIEFDVRQLLASLPPHLREIAERLSETPKKATVAKAIGLSRRRVRTAMQTLREIFRRAGYAEI